MTQPRPSDSTEIGQPIQLVAPISGDQLTLDAPLEDLGRFLAEVREVESVVKERKRYVTQEIVSRLDHSRRWTAHAGSYKLSCASPAPTEEWNGAELHTALMKLVDEGVLPVEAVDAAVETVVSYKPRKAGITALRKGGGEAAAVVDELCQSVQKDRYVKVERA